LDDALEAVKVRNASAHRLLVADLRPFFKWAKKRVPCHGVGFKRM